MTDALKQRVLDLLMQFPVESVTGPTFSSGVAGERQYSNTNKMIAAQLGVKERTVKAYIKSIAKTWGIEAADGMILRQRVVYLAAMHRGLVPPLKPKKSDTVLP